MLFSAHIVGLMSTENSKINDGWGTPRSLEKKENVPWDLYSDRFISSAQIPQSLPVMSSVPRRVVGVTRK
jgi:hypothetical protein